MPRGLRCQSLIQYLARSDHQQLLIKLKFSAQICDVATSELETGYFMNSSIFFFNLGKNCVSWDNFLQNEYILGQASQPVLRLNFSILNERQ